MIFKMEALGNRGIKLSSFKSILEILINRISPIYGSLKDKCDHMYDLMGLSDESVL